MNYELDWLSKFRNLNISNYIKNSLYFLVSFIFISFYYNKAFPQNNLLSLVTAIFGLAIYLVSLVNIKKGVYFFIFLIPLFGSLPKILNLPETPIILFLFFFLFLGFILKRAKNYLDFSSLDSHAVFNEKDKIGNLTCFSFIDSKFKMAVFLFCLMAFVSALITEWRYSNFYPFITNNYYNFKVNVLGYRSTDAIYWTVKCFFNYVVGFGFLYVISNVLEGKKDILKVLFSIFLSVILIFAVFLYQLFRNPSFGNLQMWVDAQRFNSTFSDPNSLGNFIIIIFPVLLGLIIYFKKWWLKLVTLLFIGIIFILFLFSGSRNAFIGVFISTAIFIGVFIVRGLVKLSRKVSLRIGLAKTIVIIAVIVLLIISAVISPLYFIKRGDTLDEVDKPKTNISLIDRMVSTIWMSYNTYVLADFKEAFKSVSSFRYALWNQAIDMSSDFPVTGVGAGSFIIELPNYYEKNKSEVREIDYAGNYYLQVMAELGIPALLLILFMFYIIIKEPLVYFARNNEGKDDKINNEYINKNVNKDNWLLIGFLTSFSSMVLILFLGPHINFFEILFYFYLVIGLTFVFINSESYQSSKNDNFIVKNYDIQNQSFIDASITRAKKQKIISIVLIVIVIVVYSVNFFLVSFNKISIAHNQNNYGINNNFGFYEQEKSGKYFYRWTSSDAGLTIPKEGNRLIIPLRAAHPEIENNNVCLNIFINNRRVKKVIFKDNEWKEINIDVSEFAGERISILFVCNRTWAPKDYGLEDERILGVAVGEMKFLK